MQRTYERIRSYYLNDDSNLEQPETRRDLVDPGFPRKLLGGYAHFRKTRLSRERERYEQLAETCLLYTSPSPRDRQKSRMPSSA